MVNTGKPSGGCKTCKARRIKCDESRPFCLRCRSTNRTCPGYPKKDTIEIKDETRLVQERYAKKLEYRSRKSTPLDLDVVIQSQRSSSEPSLEKCNDRSGVVLHSLSDVPRTVTESIDNLALAYFFDHYCLGKKVPSTPRLYFVNLRSYYTLSSITSSLFHAVHAVALSVLANISKFDWIQERALGSYGQSLKLLGEAISNKEFAKDNQVIMTALMLCMFEVQQKSGFSTDNYQSHLRGLALLLKNQGAAEVRSQRSIGLFRAVRHLIILQAIRHTCPLDPFWRSDEGFLDREDEFEVPGSRLDAIAVGIPMLQSRATLLNRKISNDEDALSLLSDAYDMDNKLINAYRKFLSIHQPSPAREDEYDTSITSATLDPPPNAKSPTYPVLSAYYNNCRMYRIQVHAVILRCLAFLLPVEQLMQDYRYIKALHTCRLSCNEICINVDNFFKSDAACLKVEAGGLDKMPIGLGQGAWGAFSQVWPLSIVSSVEILPTERRDWIKSKLQIITDKYGFSHAVNMGENEPYLLFGKLGPKQPLRQLASYSPHMMPTKA